jgi:hypothetical protein
VPLLLEDGDREAADRLEKAAALDLLSKEESDNLALARDRLDRR